MMGIGAGTQEPRVTYDALRALDRNTQRVANVPAQRMSPGELQRLFPTFRDDAAQMVVDTMQNASYVTIDRPPMGRLRQPARRRHHPRRPLRQRSPHRPHPPPRRTRGPGLARCSAIAADPPVHKGVVELADHQTLGFTFTCLINASVDRVFNTITDRAAISTFFTDASSGALNPGSTVLWRFGDLEIDLDVEEAVPNQRIVANWPASQDVGFTAPDSALRSNHTAKSTTVLVSESGWRDDGPGLVSAFDQCSGWTHFFASLKARLEHNVDLKHFYAD